MPHGNFFAKESNYVTQCDFSTASPASISLILADEVGVTGSHFFLLQPICVCPRIASDWSMA
jgi:hypothetical protein